jgi:tetratricopeptide (TPR) repeat protein
MTTREEHFYQALEHFASGQLDAAIAAYRQALALDPSYTDALHGLAEALAQKGEVDEAISVAHRITEIDPDDVLARTSLSRLYLRKGMKKEAEDEAAKARVLGWKQQLRQQKQQDGS